MIETFLILAALLVLASAAILITPLLRKREDAQAASINTAVAWLVLLLFGSGVLYVFWSKYDWNESHVVADAPATQAAKLARQLAAKAEEPGDVPRWVELGRLYEKIGQVPLASRAYRRADKLAGGRNADAIMGLADLMVSRDLKALGGSAGRLYERVLEIDPGNGKAWFFAGIASLQRGEPAQARERIAHVLSLNPDAELRLLTERFIAGIDAQMASTTPGASGVAERGESTGKAAADAPRISVRVTLAPALAAKVPGDALLFVAARDPANPGPPFAAKRLAAKFPVDVELTPADAMMAGRQISAGGTYSVVARVALGGTPTASSGDPFGQVGYHVGKDGRLNIVIDKLSP